MRLPYLEEEKSQTQQRIINFLGLNYGCDTNVGEMSETKNITTDNFPFITQRKPRVKEVGYIAPTSLFSKSGLFVIDGTRVLFNGENVGTVTEGKKQIASIGDIVVIFPDKKYYNTETKVFGDMESSYKATGLVFRTDSEGLSVIETPKGDFPFKAGDGIRISGCKVEPGNNVSLIIRDAQARRLTFYANSFKEATETEEVTISREVPDLEFICENNYRLWGCKGDTIYASKYGDPLNFNVFDGLTGDSYYIQVGTDGRFTGCASFSSHICFFKEDAVHKLYGSKPSNYQIVTANVFGVQAGCDRSISTINETLYYLGRNGIYAYNGGVPELISAAFGTRRFSEGCAETDGEKYYISMKEGDTWGLYVYDVRRALWIREDDTHALDMASLDGKMCILSDDGNLYSINGDAETSDEVIEWGVTFCTFNETVNERKGYSRLGIRLELGEQAYLTVEISIDDGVWEEIYTTHNERAKTINIPVIPNRCDNFRVRLSGVGECKIKSLVREFTVGSEV